MVNDYPPGYGADSERTSAIGEIFIEHVLRNRYLWAIAVANAFVYFVRYGVELDSDLSPDREGLLVPGVEHRLGALRRRSGNDRCGWVSDRVFTGAARRRRSSS